MHLTCETVFLLPSMFLISQLHHIRHRRLIQDSLFTCLVVSFIFVSKLTSLRLFNLCHGLVPWNIDIWCLQVFGV